MTCPVQERGAIELLFYGELPAAERAEVQAHLRECAGCRRALDDLSLIRAALASRPDIATPAGADWSPFMARLDEAIEAMRVPRRRPFATRALPYLAAAAVLALATVAAVMVIRARTEPPQLTRSAAPAAARAASPRPDPGLLSVSGQHFERSKLVVLGLTTKDASAPQGASWTYERELAARLLADTRLYRHAAEERGMGRLAGVMRDLELVLLQASMAEEPDAQSLEGLQRLIRRRDLITRMNAGYVTAP